MYSHHAAKLTNPARFSLLVKAAAEHDLRLYFEGTIYVRGWPEASTRPYRLHNASGRFIGAYSTLDNVARAIGKRS